MYFYLASRINLLHFFFIVNLIISCASSATLANPYDFIGDVAINCGSVGYATALDGREWIGDTSSKYSYFPKPKGKSRSSAVVHKSFHVDHVPSMTARISSAQFHYSFQLNPGQIFIRLHFYPALYRGFEKSYDFFTVKAGHFTLLSNFSASLAADALGVKYLVKEYCMNVEEDRTMNIVFLPSKLGKLEKTHAFINGIEILSVPTGLYFTNLGAHIVGQNDRFYVDSRTAFETVQRLNVGGNPISPAEDSGLYRSWSADVDFLMESDVKSVQYARPMVKIQSMPVHVAPLKIYQTSWSTNPKKLGNKIYNLTWKIPVNIGFRYLIRLHFCEFDAKVAMSGQREFNISLNNQLVETNANIVQWGGGNGIPVHKDYMVIIKGTRGEDKYIILVTLQSKIELIDGPLRGLEILKLSNPDNNLASPGPKFSQQASPSWISRLVKLILISASRLGIPTFLTIVMILINIVAYHLQKFLMENIPETHVNLVQRDNSGQDKTIPSLSIENEDRPTVAQVFTGLELSLQQEQQENAPSLPEDVEAVDLPNLESTKPLEVLHSISEEISDVGGPHTEVTVEKYEMEHSSLGNSISTSEVEMRKNKRNNKALFRRSKRDTTSNSKPARRRPWYMIWTRARPSNATELYPGGGFKLKHIKAATKNFNVANKLGEGGFGPVYKGTLPDGTEIAVKKLSARSRQGVREFVNEIGIISAIQHQNLVRLFGSIVERDQLLLIYEYMKNNSLQHALFGPDDDIRMRLNWQTRVKIWLGVAKGLAFLHEESRVKFVHRDVKTSNILLDEEFNAKLSDFGLARLYDDNVTHVSTRIAGTIGYMAPEYAMRGHLTTKADVYSFGIVMLEIVSGRRNSAYDKSSDQHVYLLDEAYELQKQGNLLELVDPNLQHECSRDEAATVLELAISCTHPSPSSRPTMSEIVKILEGKKNIGSLTMTMPFRIPVFSQSRESSSSSQQLPPNTNTIVSYSSIKRKDQSSSIVASHSSIKSKERPNPFHSLPFFKKATRPVPQTQEKSTPNDRFYYTFY